MLPLLVGQWGLLGRSATNQTTDKKQGICTCKIQVDKQYFSHTVMMDWHGLDAAGRTIRCKPLLFWYHFPPLTSPCAPQLLSSSNSTAIISILG
jgi:hypothetical protein